MYNINSKINLSIALLSDIHYSNKNKKVLNKILLKFNNIKPDYICIPGDILDESTDYDKNVYNFFVSLSKISKVIISLGNHDISIINKKQKYFDNKWYLNLKDIKNVYVLNNKQITFNNITFTGYNSPLKDKYLDNPINTLNDLKNLDFKTNYFNILLTHSPQSILGLDELYNNNFIKKQDLILCGHMHNGLIPHIFNKYNFHIGLIGPTKRLFPKYSRGIFKINNTYLIISKGITKLAKHSYFLRPFNILYPIDIEIINIRKVL